MTGSSSSGNGASCLPRTKRQESREAVVKRWLVFGIAVAVVCMAGCTGKGGEGRPVEELEIASTVSSDEFVAGLPAELSGKEWLKTKKASIDTVNGKTADIDRRWYLNQGKDIEIGGWIYDESQSSTGKVYVELAGAENRYYALVTQRVSRPDVAKSLGVDNGEYGFLQKMRANKIPAGFYRVAVLQLSDGKVLRFESSGRLAFGEK